MEDYLEIDQENLSFTVLIPATFSDVIAQAITKMGKDAAKQMEPVVRLFKVDGRRERTGGAFKKQGATVECNLNALQIHLLMEQQVPLCHIMFTKSHDHYVVRARVGMHASVGMCLS